MRDNTIRRRGFLGLAAGTVAAVTGSTAMTAAASPRCDRIAYLGSYSSGSEPGDGLDVASVGAGHGLAVTAAVTGAPDASWLARSADGRFLYATDETEDGAVTALSLADPAHPRSLGSTSTGGHQPTHLSLHPSGRHLLTADYGSGTVTVLPVAADGTLGERTDLVQHQPGSREPHAHQVVTDPSGDWVIAVDLGADSVFVYALDLDRGTLTEHQHLVLPDGAGPRHLGFHPSGAFAYVLQELRPEITVCAWDAGTGTLTPGQVVGTAAAGSDNAPAEIAVAADGRFVHVTNRGDNTVATLSTSDDGSTLALRGATPTGGNWPRHLAIDAAQEWVYVANQRSGTVTWLPLDHATGTVGPAAGSLPVPSAAMVLLT